MTWERAGQGGRGGRGLRRWKHVESQVFSHGPINFFSFFFSGIITEGLLPIKYAREINYSYYRPPVRG